MYLTNEQLNEMANAALRSYEMTADWRDARAAAFEYAVDEFRIKPRNSAVILAMKMAQSKWYGIRISVQKQIHN